MRNRVHNIKYSSTQSISYNLPFTVKVRAWKLHEQGFQKLGEVKRFAGIEGVVL
jgi:hypothetical protein